MSAETSAVLATITGRRVQLPGPAIVTKPFPEPQHFFFRAAASTIVGKAAKIARSSGLTVAACVCCSITSLTQMRYGSASAAKINRERFWRTKSEQATAKGTLPGGVGAGASRSSAVETEEIESADYADGCR